MSLKPSGRYGSIRYALKHRVCNLYKCQLKNYERSETCDTRNKWKRSRRGWMRRSRWRWRSKKKSWSSTSKPAQSGSCCMDWQALGLGYWQLDFLDKNVFSCSKNQASKMIQECPKCKDSYFTLVIRWISSYIITEYICESCNWNFVTSNCTLTASAPDLSCSNQSVVSVGQAQ